MQASGDIVALKESQSFVVHQNYIIIISSNPFTSVIDFRKFVQVFNLVLASNLPS